MARPNPDGKLKILVCGDDMDKFSEIVNVLDNENRWSNSNFSLYKDLDGMKIDAGGFELTRIRNVNQAIKALDDHDTRTIPYYAGVIYDSSLVHGNVMRIARVRRRDPFVPQLVYGDDCSRDDLMAASRAGCSNTATDAMKLINEFKNLYRSSPKIENITVFKDGGSSFDYDRQIKDKINLDQVCKILVDIFKDVTNGDYRDGRGKLVRKEIVNGILLAVGAGEFGEIIKEHEKKYGYIPDVKEAFPELMAGALLDNTELLYTHLGKENAMMCGANNYYLINQRNTRDRIPLLPIAPHYILARDRIPLQDSDTGTIASAEHVRAKRVVLIKRTDGIYDFDPYRGFVLNESTYRCASHRKWRSAQKRNKRHEVAYLEDMIKGGFSREGTGPDGQADGSLGHLMEDSALIYFRDKCEHVKEILVVHIAPEEMYYEKDGVFRHVILPGETMPLNTNWYEVLKQNIENAFEGKANSKIVRD